MDSIYLSKDTIKNAIISYYSQNNTNKLDVDISFNIYDDEINITFSLIEVLEAERIKYYRRTKLSENDLIRVFNHYLKDKNLEFIKFKYIGGIRRVGYFIDEDTAIFEGIEIFVREKGYSRKLVKK